MFYKRKDAFARIEDCGGIPQKTVTKETDILVVGYYRKGTLHGIKSQKRLTAEKYSRQGQDIQIIREDEFLPMIWSAKED